MATTTYPIIISTSTSNTTHKRSIGSPRSPPPPASGVTFKYQDKLPKLPIPALEDSLAKYLKAVKPLQTPEEHETTQKAVKEFMKKEGPELQNKLKTYATDKSSYIEEFWYDSYLQHTDPVVLHLNPFFLLEDDPTPLRSNQINRASSLIFSTLKFIEILENKLLEPDTVRGRALCMSQFERLFSTARVPTDQNECYIKKVEKSKHIVVMAQSQFYHFDVFEDGNILLTEKELAANLKAIIKDANENPSVHPMGVLTTENRSNWAKLRNELESDEMNKEALHVIDSALFIVCLDNTEPQDINELSTNMLCGTYRLVNGQQVGTCTNRWYDKLQIIVCKNGSAGINFEHTGVDGHTVLRYVSDIYTETILRFAKTINQQTKSMFNSRQPSKHHLKDINPRKIEWKLTDPLRLGIQFAETRLSDLILQNEMKVLEFSNYGKGFITEMKMSPDAFVQMAIQAAYYGLYGKCESTYEPAMTKTFLHGRTEAIRTVSDASIQFVTAFYSKHSTNQDRLNLLRKALQYHTQLTRECAQGLGQDRHLYALKCVWERESTDKLSFYEDPGWKTLNHTMISTSNCGNPALRLFGFGPVVSNGFGIGYIIKEDGIAFVASSKHRQTRRLLDTLNTYLLDIQKLLLKERYPTGVSQRQRILELEEEESTYSNGYSYFDNGNESDLSSHSSHSYHSLSPKRIGKRLVIHETD
ncbi:acyltransferase ChoActase/COT/CPT [Pilobolus umbonatus]|nr:acyltransferase ChoActase/COT/CPT [Pilobolus umbonatus]